MDPALNGLRPALRPRLWLLVPASLQLRPQGLLLVQNGGQSRSQRLHSFWSAPRMQDLWDNQCQNADESKSDWLLKFTGSLRVRSFKTGNEKCLAMFLLDVFDHARDGQPCIRQLRPRYERQSKPWCPVSVLGYGSECYD